MPHDVKRPRTGALARHSHVPRGIRHRMTPPCASRVVASRRLRYALSALTALLLLLGPLGAAHGATWYTVEMIVFERIGDANLDDEVWLADPGRPPVEESIALGRASGSASPEASGEGSAVPRNAFRLLDRRHFRLGGVFDRLRDSGVYRPLLHIAWRQPGYSRGRARHAHIQGWRNSFGPGGFGALPPGVGAWPVIDGTVQLYARRFLHLRADLLYYRRDPRGEANYVEASDFPASASAPTAQGEASSATEPVPGTESQSDSGSEDGAVANALPLPESPSLAAGGASDPALGSASGTNAGLGAADEHRGVATDGPPPVFRMTTSRRMRPGDLHYLDHPLFGVLVIVTRNAPAGG